MSRPVESQRDQFPHRVAMQHRGMAWDEWSDRIQKKGKGAPCGPGGCDHTDERETGYLIDDPDKGALGELNFSHRLKDNKPQVVIDWLWTHPSHRNDGMAEAMMRRLHQDHPHALINPGAMLSDGVRFHDHMLAKEPDAKKVMARIAMPAPLPESRHVTAAYGFQKGEMPYAGGHRMEAFDADTGETVGYLEHDRDNGKVSSIWVHPDHRGQGIATDLFNWTKKHVNSRLHHSDDLTDEGRAWAESMGHDTGNARTVQWPDDPAANHRTAADWSQPNHLNTPLYGPDERRQFYHPTEFTHRHEFSPTEFNPHADASARPRLRWRPTQPEQDTLDLDVPTHFTYRPGETPESIEKLISEPWKNPALRGTTPDGVYPVDREPIKLYRGVNLDLREPGLQAVHRALWGPQYAYPTHFADETENPGLFPRPKHTPDPRGFDNTDLGQMILDHVAHWHPDENQRGLGRHWSTDPQTAKDFAGTAYRHNQPALLSAEWMGRGEDPYRTDAYGNYTGEKEITMMGGAPLRITQVHLRHPDTGKWHPVLGTGPQHREAALDPADLLPLYRDKYPQWRSELPAELAAHYDDHPDLEHEDFLGQIHRRKSPWENSEAAMISTGPQSFSTSRYPTVADRPHHPDQGYRHDYRFHFAPNEVNPRAATPARPEPDWTDEHLDQDTLPGEWPRGRSTELHRGLSINLKYAPELARALDQNHPDLAHRILDHLNTGRGGLGTHWSTDPEVAHGYASGDRSEHTLPVMMTTRWTGAGEDPYRHDSYGEFPDVKEITLLPGADTPITNLSIRHPATGQWHSLLNGIPQHRQAAFNDDEDEDNEDDGTYCASCGPDDPDWCESCEECTSCNPDHQNHCETCGAGDADWCEDCQECKSCDSHEEHCEKCGPGDSDWCESCDTCSSCDPDHETHCPSCGPGDYDWCEDCGQCKACDWHDEHCPYCGPGDGDWCENCESCKSCGDCECDPSAEPIHYDTPLYKDRERPLTKEYTERGDRMRLFLPNEINPASAADSRPMVHFPENEDEDPVLLGDNLVYSNGIDRIPASTTGAELYRGLTINLKRHPELAPLRRAIYGDEKESYYSGDPVSANPAFNRNRVVQPGMFPGPYSDAELAAPPAHPDRLHQYLPDILHHLDNYVGYRGLGEHWSTRLDQADSFAGPGNVFNEQNGHLPVRLTGRWFGHGEDPYRPNTGEEQAGQFEEEREISLRPHAPIKLTDLEIYHPKTKQWHSLMDLPDPIQVHARRRR